MPTDNNPAEAHLAWVRSMTGVPELKADAAPASVRRDNATSTSEPVVGAQGAAEIERALNRVDRRR
jgi:hypothetical protein